jgi:hypothetical protein
MPCTRDTPLTSFPKRSMRAFAFSSALSFSSSHHSQGRYFASRHATKVTQSAAVHRARFRNNATPRAASKVLTHCDVHEGGDDFLVARTHDALVEVALVPVCQVRAHAAFVHSACVTDVLGARIPPIRRALPAVERVRYPVHAVAQLDDANWTLVGVGRRESRSRQRHLRHCSGSRVVGRSQLRRPVNEITQPRGHASAKAPLSKSLVGIGMGRGPRSCTSKSS